MTEDEDLGRIAELAEKLTEQWSIKGACADVLRLGMDLTGSACSEVLFRDTESRQLVCLAHEGGYPWCACEANGRRLGSRVLAASLEDRQPLHVAEVREQESPGFDLPVTSERLRSTEPPDGLSAAIENVVYRVIQEAVNNVARHSGATTCKLVLSATPSTVSAVVEDNGRGFSAGGGDDSIHIGLKSMRERMEVLGGTLRSSSSPGAGCRVEVHVPHKGKTWP